MEAYRLYPTNDHGKVTGPPALIEASDDEHALQMAVGILDYCRREIWRGSRFLTVLDDDQGNSEISDREVSSGKGNATSSGFGTDVEFSKLGTMTFGVRRVPA